MMNFAATSFFTVDVAILNLKRNYVFHLCDFSRPLAITIEIDVNLVVDLNL